MSATAAALRFDHLALPVFDVAATYRFYREILQLPLTATLTGDDWGGKPWLMMIFGTADGRQLALCALRGATPPHKDELPDDIRHFAFSVCSAHEQLAWKERLREHGVQFSEEDHGSQRSIYFRDPNGIMLEITTPSSEEIVEVDAAAHETVQRWIAIGNPTSE
jgi:catechol 2,3-dioxygenase-like lactoylglutathione lyase family enzyme